MALAVHDVSTERMTQLADRGYAKDGIQTISDTWRQRYNTVRPHDSLGRVPPLAFLPRATAA